MTESSRKDPSGSSSPKSPEVLEKPVRRRFDAKYKVRILELAEQCKAVGLKKPLLVTDKALASLPTRPTATAGRALFLASDYVEAAA